jgi:molecular chaperone Hsp33
VQYREDHLIQATTAGATVRLIAAVTTNLVQEGRRRHRTSPTASAALGRTMTGALLLGRTFKDLEYLTLRFDCKGPIGGVVAEANAHGSVRGYVKNPSADLPPNEAGKLDVRGVVGPGVLHVIREAGHEIGLARDPYFGSSPIVSGEIAEDLTHYLAVSEQIRSSVALGVFVEPEMGAITAAGGFLIQVMPGCEDGVIASLEEAIARAPQVTTILRDGADAVEMLRTVLGEIDFNLLETIPAEFRCKCSYERAFNIVAALGEEEVRDMLVKDNGAELTCHFCNEVYFLDESALEEMLAPPSLPVM